MRQIVYISLSTVPGDEAELENILLRSRHNNAIDGVTGLLWSDGRSFLQALEGPRASVELTWDRIRADPRHHSIKVLSDRLIEAREFGSWTMAHRLGNEPVDGYDMLARRVLYKTSEAVRAQFLSLIAAGPKASLAHLRS